MPPNSSSENVRVLVGPSELEGTAWRVVVLPSGERVSEVWGGTSEGWVPWPPMWPGRVLDGWPIPEAEASRWGFPWEPGDPNVSPEDLYDSAPGDAG